MESVGGLVLSIALETISKSTLHDLARKVSEEVKIASEAKHRWCIVVA
ncbi:MAG: hypothetical protein QW756_00030 [Nitrososphaerota archaeon]